MPIPVPTKQEIKDNDKTGFVSRCVSAIYDEYGKDQALGICFSQWANKNKKKSKAEEINSKDGKLGILITQ